MWNIMYAFTSGDGDRRLAVTSTRSATCRRHRLLYDVVRFIYYHQFYSQRRLDLASFSPHGQFSTRFGLFFSRKC